VKQEQFLRNVIEILITLLMLASLAVSAQHYGVVLNKHAGESLLTAWTIGIIFDLFHLAAILMAVIGKNKWFWFTALVTTLISFYYHHLFYNNFAFSVPFALMLFSLATFKAYLMRTGTVEESDSLSRKPGETKADFEARQMLQSEFGISTGEAKSQESQKPKSQESQESQKPKSQESQKPKSQESQESQKPKSQESQKPKSQEAEKANGLFVCEICKSYGKPEADYTFNSVYALAGHKKRHVRAKREAAENDGK
jgi:glucan phosphoethanolaminetransferase (alkaline phosphatase superfamily)